MDEEQHEAGLVGEARWPMAAAVLVTMFFTLLIPEDLRLMPAWVFPAIEGVLLIALIAGDPGEISRRSKQLRIVSLVLVGVLVVASLMATALLVGAIIEGGEKLDSAGTLLSAGAIVWVCTVLAFALLFWELDSGGAAERAHSARRHPDFAFIQQANPHLGAPGWRPQFVDYLYLGITNAIAFSPTDVMPLTPWAKMAMAVQSIVSLAIVGLVIARAVNVLQ